MSNRANVLIAAAALICLIPAAAFAEITAYSQDFETLDAGNLLALGNDGWLVYGNVYAAGTGVWLRGYGPYPAPNNPAAPAFCNLVIGEGGDDQGAQQLSVFSDYENTADQVAGNLVEANVYRERVISATDVGKTWIFEFQAKMGLLVAPSTALAFIKTIDPANSYATTNFIQADMTAITTEWGGWSLSLAIDASLEGQLFQIGFASTATLYVGSSIIYDNVVLREALSAVPGLGTALGATLRQNYPNPFNPMTRIDFSLDNPGRVDLGVFDIAGRLVARLLGQDMAAGDHSVTWNGQTRSGSPAAAGQYLYVMKTGTGQVARSMILLK